jgi:hypothetical protein
MYSLLIAAVSCIPQATAGQAIINTFPLFMQYSAVSYCDFVNEGVKALNCGRKCDGDVRETVVDVTAYDRKTTAAAFVGYHPRKKLIVAAFRGTASVQSAIYDLKFWQSEADWQSKWPAFVRQSNARLPSGLKVHAGFEASYVPIRSTIQSSVVKLAKQFPDYQIVFTGHSLGGAMAQMAAVDYHDVNGNADRISLYTYGAPRVGNDDWARFVDNLPFSNRMYRITRDGDPVPHLPLIAMGYLHSKQNFLLRDSGETSQCRNARDSGESPQCLNDLWEMNILKHLVYYKWESNPFNC